MVERALKSYGPGEGEDEGQLPGGTLEQQPEGPRVNPTELAGLAQDYVTTTLATVDPRLASAAGLLAITQELGVVFDQPLTTETVGAFLGAVSEQLRAEPLAVVAFALAVHGHLAVEAGEVPMHATHEHENPIGAYYGAVEYLNRWLDARRGLAAMPPEAEGLFETRRRTVHWERAVRAARAVEEGLIRRLTDEGAPQGEAEIPVGRKAHQRLQIHNASGHPVEGIVCNLYFTKNHIGKRCTPGAAACAPQPAESRNARNGSVFHR
jgi:hypothetical protein